MTKTHPSQTEEAEGEILRGIEMAEEGHLRGYAAVGYGFMGELYAERGEKKKAKETLHKAKGMLEEMGMMGYWLTQWQAALA